MPIYEYICEKCGEKLDFFQKITDSPYEIHEKSSNMNSSSIEKCGGKLKRIISGGCYLIFKGSGFYTTDYKKNKINTIDE